MENQPTQNPAQPQSPPYAPNFAQPVQPTQPTAPPPGLQPQQVPPVPPAAPEYMAPEQPLTQPLPAPVQNEQPKPEAKPENSENSARDSQEKSKDKGKEDKNDDKEGSKKEESKSKLKEAIQGSNDVLASATTTMTLFPDTLTVDRAKVTVTRRNFFRTAEVMSMRIEDILNVTTTVGPYFGTVKIVSRVLNAEKPYTVGLFKRADATRLKRILQGYVIALQRDIDCSSLPTEELINMLDNLGEDDHPTVPSEESP